MEDKVVLVRTDRTVENAVAEVSPVDFFILELSGICETVGHFCMRSGLTRDQTIKSLRHLARAGLLEPSEEAIMLYGDSSVIFMSREPSTGRLGPMGRTAKLDDDMASFPEIADESSYVDDSMTPEKSAPPVVPTKPEVPVVKTPIRSNTGLKAEDLFDGLSEASESRFLTEASDGRYDVSDPPPPKRERSSPRIPNIMKKKTVVRSKAQLESEVAKLKAIDPEDKPKAKQPQPKKAAVEPVSTIAETRRVAVLTNMLEDTSVYEEQALERENEKALEKEFEIEEIPKMPQEEDTTPTLTDSEFYFAADDD